MSVVSPTTSPSRRRRRVVSVATLASENPARHQIDPSRQVPPRPLGVASGMPWQPRNPSRSYVGNTITVRFLEALESHPALQALAAAALRVVARPFVQHEVAPPADVPNPAGSWKFAALGDYGSGRPQQARVAANILAGNPELVITAGDNVYPTGRWEDYARHWDPPHLAGRLARSVPFMPALGNHDMYRDDLRPYFAHFPHLSGQPYYTFKHRNAQFFALDSDQDLRVGSAQYRWLDQELGRSDRQWKVVYLHYPMYGQGSFTEVRDAVQPLLAKHGVQLVVAGHEHSYSRSVPIAGVTHILTGGGGQMVYPILKNKPAWLTRRVAAFHHVEVHVASDQLVVRAIDEHGKRIDTAVIPYRGVGQARQGAQQLAPDVAAPRRRARQRRARGSAPASSRS